MSGRVAVSPLQRRYGYQRFNAYRHRLVQPVHGGATRSTFACPLAGPGVANPGSFALRLTAGDAAIDAAFRQECSLPVRDGLHSEKPSSAAPKQTTTDSKSEGDAALDRLTSDQGDAPVDAAVPNVFDCSVAAIPVDAGASADEAGAGERPRYSAPADATDDRMLAQAMGWFTEPMRDGSGHVQQRRRNVRVGRDYADDVPVDARRPLPHRFDAVAGAVELTGNRVADRLWSPVFACEDSFRRWTVAEAPSECLAARAYVRRTIAAAFLGAALPNVRGVPMAADAVVDPATGATVLILGRHGAGKTTTAMHAVLGAPADSPTSLLASGVAIVSPAAGASSPGELQVLGLPLHPSLNAGTFASLVAAGHDQLRTGAAKCLPGGSAAAVDEWLKTAVPAQASAAALQSSQRSLTVPVGSSPQLIGRLAGVVMLTWRPAALGTGPSVGGARARRHQASELRKRALDDASVRHRCGLVPADVVPLRALLGAASPERLEASSRQLIDWLTAAPAAFWQVDGSADPAAAGRLVNRVLRGETEKPRAAAPEFSV